MRWPPSKGVIIRLFIYLPIIGFLIWRILGDRIADEKFDVIQITPEQAEQMMGRPLPRPAEAEAKVDREPAAPDSGADPSPQ